MPTVLRVVKIIPMCLTVLGKGRSYKLNGRGGTGYIHTLCVWKALVAGYEAMVPYLNFRIVIGWV